MSIYMLKVKAQGMLQNISKIKGRAYYNVHQNESLKLSYIISAIIIAI